MEDGVQLPIVHVGKLTDFIYINLEKFLLGRYKKMVHFSAIYFKLWWNIVFVIDAMKLPFIIRGTA